MAYQVTLATLQRRVLQRTDLEGALGQSISPEELTDVINASIADWYDLVRLTTWGGTYYVSQTTINSVAGTQLYPLPDDFLALQYMNVYPSSSCPVRMKPYQNEDDAALQGIGQLLVPGVPFRYNIKGGNISFRPIPSGVYPVIIYYTPTAPTLEEPTDFIDDVNSWSEFIVLDAGAKLLHKEGALELRGALIQEREAQRARIMSAAAERDEGFAEVVHDVVGDSFGGRFGGGWGGGGFY